MSMCVSLPAVITYSEHEMCLPAGVATAVSRATALGEADRIGATLHGAAGGLAYAADGVRGALQGLAEQANDGCHFYRSALILFEGRGAHP
jgi:hypothetical protein